MLVHELQVGVSFGARLPSESCGNNQIVSLFVLARKSSMQLAAFLCPIALQVLKYKRVADWRFASSCESHYCVHVTIKQLYARQAPNHKCRNSRIILTHEYEIKPLNYHHKLSICFTPRPVYSIQAFIAKMLCYNPGCTLMDKYCVTKMSTEMPVYY